MLLLPAGGARGLAGKVVEHPGDARDSAYLTHLGRTVGSLGNKVGCECLGNKESCESRGKGQL